MVIGRDMIRLLQDLTKIPQFHALWDDMLNKPNSLSPRFESISQILTMRTHKKFLHSRVTPDIEKQLLFILQQVLILNNLKIIKLKNDDGWKINVKK